MEINLKKPQPVFYKNGLENEETFIGWIDSESTRDCYTCKFSFTSPDTGGLDFVFSFTPQEVIIQDENKLQFFYYITTEDNQVNRRIPNKKTGVLQFNSSDGSYTFSSQDEYTFMPRTDYYIYVYASSLNSNYINFGDVDSENNSAFITITGETLSKIYTGNGTLGEEHKIFINKAIDDYTYQIVLTCEATSVVLDISPGEEEIKWIPPMEWAQFAPNDNQVRVEAVANSYKNNILVGSSSTDIYFKIPENDATRLQVDFSIKQISGENESIIQNLTQVQIQSNIVEGSGYGTSIIGYIFHCNDYYYHGENPIFFLPEIDNEIIGYAIDGRGRIYNFNLTQEAIEYHVPKVKITSIHRCDENGNNSFSGQNATIFYELDYSNLPNNMPKIEFYIYDIEEETMLIYEQSNYSSIGTQFLPNLLLEKNYKIHIKVSDNYKENTSNSIYLSSKNPIIDIRKNTKSMGLFHQATKVNAIVSGVPIKLTTEPLEDDEVITKGYFENQTKSLTIELQPSNWINNRQIIDIDGLSVTDIVITSPVSERKNLKEYAGCSIICAEQLKNQLVFECETKPSSSIPINIFVYTYNLRVGKLFIDFNYIVNDDGTYTLTGWKHTLDGELSNRMIVPANELIRI